MNPHPKNILLRTADYPEAQQIFGLIQVPASLNIEELYSAFIKNFGWENPRLLRADDIEYMDMEEPDSKAAQACLEAGLEIKVLLEEPGGLTGDDLVTWCSACHLFFVDWLVKNHGARRIDLQIKELY